MLSKTKTYLSRISCLRERNATNHIGSICSLLLESALDMCARERIV